MPFINIPLQNTNTLYKNILFMSVDGSDTWSSAFSLCQYIKNQNHLPLLVDGNIGVSLKEKIDLHLDKVLMDKAALSKAIHYIKQIPILSGKAIHPLSVKPKSFQQQFISDLIILSGNFDKTIVSLSSENISLQELWLSWAEKKFLFFQTSNLFLEKTAQFLFDYPNQIDGLISVDNNPHLSRLAWLRLKKMFPDLPELISDIKQTAQK